MLPKLSGLGEVAACARLSSSWWHPSPFARYYSVAERSLLVTVHFCGTAGTPNCGTLSPMRSAIDIDEW